MNFSISINFVTVRNGNNEFSANIIAIDESDADLNIKSTLKNSDRAKLYESVKKEVTRIMDRYCEVYDFIGNKNKTIKECEIARKDKIQKRGGS